MSLIRLDKLLLERGLAVSREKAQALILAGTVWSQQTRLEKAGTRYPDHISLEVRGTTGPFVSRAGEKLQHAIERFDLSVRDRICLDVGASTGGFTDCLLQRGAAHVFAVDVGYGLVDSKLRHLDRVTLVERQNARYLTQEVLTQQNDAAERISVVTMDVSFISLEKIIPALALFIPKPSDWVLLFKPQFEVGRQFIRKGGVVSDESATLNALSQFHAFMETLHFTQKHSPETSPIAGKKKGNIEWLLHYELCN